MMWLRILGVALIATGFLLEIVGIWGNRLHARLFRNHLDHLEGASTDEEIHAEMRRFHEDDRIDKAMVLMGLDLIGIPMLGIGTIPLVLSAC